MSALAQRSRTVHVPASSGNLGPGYDVLGAALGIELVLEVEEVGAFSVDAGGLPVPEPIATTSSSAPSSASIPPTSIAFRIGGEIPLARGLGSSAAAIVAGLLAADHLFELGNSRERIFELACEIEGHPDNVAAALFGGIASAAATDSARHSAPDPIELAAGTAPARRCRCRRSSPRRRASRRSSSSPTRRSRPRPPARRCRPSCRSPTRFTTSPPPPQLVLGIERSDLTLIERGLADRMHQPRRRPLYPRSMEIVEAAREPRRDRGDDLRRRPDRARLELLAVGREGRRGARRRSAPAGPR